MALAFRSVTVRSVLTDRFLTRKTLNRSMQSFQKTIKIDESLNVATKVSSTLKQMRVC